MSLIVACSVSRGSFTLDVDLEAPGGQVTAVLGPQVVIFTREMLAPVMFAGSFVSIIALGDGLVMRALVDPDAVPAEHAPPADASDDARGSWHLFALGTRALIREMTRPRSS